MREKKIRFRFSSQTVPHETQTTLLTTNIQKNVPTIDKMRISDTNTLLQNEVRPITTFTRSMMQGYNSRLSFLVTAVSDPRFEPLSPPHEMYSDLQIGFKCQLNDKYFTLSTPNDHHKNDFQYAEHLVSFLECLETGTLTPEILMLLTKLKVKTWDNGFIICQVIDNRITPKVISYVKLEIGPDVLGLPNFRQPNPEAKLDFERRVLLLKRPMICTDPSPDVARVQSCVDWRKKMWVPTKPRKKENIEPPPEPPKKAPPVVAAHFTQLRTKVDIPETLQQRFVMIVNQPKP
ncbi:hypothetical protein TRFO_20970 [Tritrichomonas foetus]|uniref:Spt20-like SEP domain-containing protein n=1 Tax=Tritrichomonas foetus TaxID=1144522 RepID=A0A1J4KJI9_9EUKA|nr:hypothetical protein TRFO_20970 [Tritrichomonas foetus]|eukprot:OHT09980.1 hypothetical protein TRFO_20970 [Tritrichomonas foetus]